MNLRVLCGSENKQRLFPYTALTGWFCNPDIEYLVPSADYLTAIKLWKPSGHYTYHQVWHSTILRSVHTLYLCVLYGSQNKQRLFPCKALTEWFYNRDGVCLLRGTDWVLKYSSTFFFNLLIRSVSKDTVTRTEHKVYNVWMIIDYELERMRKRMIFALYEGLSWRLPEITEKNHESPHTVMIRRWHLQPTPGFSTNRTCYSHTCYFLHGLTISYHTFTAVD